MYNLFQQNDKELVMVNLVGDQFFKGKIIDSSSHMIILFNGENFIYIPFRHVKDIKNEEAETENKIVKPADFPSIISNSLNVNLTLEGALHKARGMYTEISVVSKKPLYGTVGEVLNDYFVFYSPIYKTMYIPIIHLKWLIPYIHGEEPYGLSKNNYKMSISDRQYKQYFSMQFAELIGRLVVINVGDKVPDIGKVETIHNNIVELRTAKENLYINMDHIQTIHVV